MVSSDDGKCRLVVDIFVDRIAGFVGSYYVKLGGDVDALVFAGGIGEKSDELRRRVVEQCRCLGFEIDPQKNQKPEAGVVADVAKEGAKHRTLLCHTYEQFERTRSCTAEAETFRSTAASS